MQSRHLIVGIILLSFIGMLVLTPRSHALEDIAVEREQMRDKFLEWEDYREEKEQYEEAVVEETKDLEKVETKDDELPWYYEKVRENQQLRKRHGAKFP